jgi:hypothetical protein
MRAERGWIGDPQPSVEWRDSHTPGRLTGSTLSLTLAGIERT